MEITGTGAAASTGVQTSAQAAVDKLANKETFLQLLVAQIRNQDPLQPTDGVEFLTQLAQFSELEQLMGIRSDLRGLATTPADTTGQAEAPAAAA
jgi:flagellar basal-body rod modification protein FlgD